MRIVDITAMGLTVELDNADCLALADACTYAVNREIPGDARHLEALGAALVAGAMAVLGLNPGMVEEEQMTLATLRELWGPMDTRNVPQVRVLEPPQ